MAVLAWWCSPAGPPTKIALDFGTGELNKSIRDNNLDASAMSLRKSLLSWLENCSLSEILEWFDCVEMADVFKEDTYPGKKLACKVTAETTARDEQFLELLGMG